MRVIIVGDISLAKMDAFALGESVAKHFADSDVVVGNLEAPLTASENRIPMKSYYLKADTSRMDLLRRFTAFSLANNHVLDYGKEGLTDTIRALCEIQTGYFGAGLTSMQSVQPYLIESKGIKLAFFGASYFFFANLGRTWCTAKTQSSRLLTCIKEFKKKGYFIILMPHWGIEHISYPSPGQRKLAKKYIAAGCDIVIGSHPHEMQGIEVVKGKVVCYSLGNFIFSSKDFRLNDNPLLYRSYFIQLDINGTNSYTYKTIPYETSDSGVEIADGAIAREVIAHLENISNKLLLPDKQYSQTFYKTAYGRFQERKSRLASINSSPKGIFGVWKYFKWKLLMLMNIDVQFLPVYCHIIRNKLRIIK